MTAERPGGGGERGKGETRKSGNARHRGEGEEEVDWVAFGQFVIKLKIPSAEAR